MTSAAESSAADLSAHAAAGRRAAWRRLSSYVRRNKGFYAFWLVTVLAYTAAFLAIPVLVGNCVKALHGLVGRLEPGPILVEGDDGVRRLLGTAQCLD